MDKRLLLLGGGALLWYLSQEQEAIKPQLPPPPQKETLPQFEHRLKQDLNARVAAGQFGPNARVVDAYTVKAPGTTWHFAYGDRKVPFSEILAGVPKQPPPKPGEVDTFKYLSNYWTVKENDISKNANRLIRGYSIDEIIMWGWMQSYLIAASEAKLFQLSGAFADKLLAWAVETAASTPMLASGPPGWIAFAIKTLGSLFIKGIEQAIEEGNIRNTEDIAVAQAYNSLGEVPSLFDDWFRSCVAWLDAHPEHLQYNSALKKVLELATASRSYGGRFSFKVLVTYTLMAEKYKAEGRIIPSPPLDKAMIDHIKNWGSPGASSSRSATPSIVPTPTLHIDYALGWLTSLWMYEDSRNLIPKEGEDVLLKWQRSRSVYLGLLTAYINNPKLLVSLESYSFVNPSGKVTMPEVNLETGQVNMVEKYVSGGALETYTYTPAFCSYETMKRLAQSGISFD